jgi:protein-S-isoprenylcysteine O-methyltransferase Ste14
MKTLPVRAFAGAINLFVIMGLLLFLPAGTWEFRDAWLFLFVWFAAVAMITAYFLKRDPGLIERRMKAGPGAEVRGRQKRLQAVAAVAFILLLVVPGLDHRYHWSRVAGLMPYAADGGVALGFLIVFFAFRSNSYSSAVIEVAAAQKVVSTGPYAVIRHPMYAGALLLVFSTPAALGSWWGLIPAFLMLVMIVLRLLDEEAALLQELPGYADYCRRVRDRLMPGVW